MAIRFDAAADNLSRTTNLPAATGYTAMGWFRIVVDRNDYGSFIAYGTAAGSYHAVGLDLDGTTLQIYNGGSGGSGMALTVGTWYHIAMTSDGTTLRAYVNGVQSTSIGYRAPGAKFWIGGDPEGFWFNGNVAGIKIYDAVLSAAEIAAEMHSYRPLRLANINAWYPCFAGTSERLRDYSGNGRDWTAGGTLTDEDGPPLTWGGPVIMIPFVPVSSGGITGTASITEAADTLSSTGVLPLAGTAALTEAADTLSAAATLPIAGAASLAEAADTLSSTGILPLAGAAALTEAADTLSAAGALPLAGAAALTEADDTLAGTGAIALRGALAVTEAADTLSATGEEPSAQAAFVASTATTGTGTAATGALPSSPTTGNVVILVSISNSGGAITPPTGYTTLLESTSDSPSVGVYYREIQGGEDTTPNLTVPGYGHTTYVAEYSGLDPDDLLADSAVTRIYSTAADAATVTTPAGGLTFAVAAVANQPDAPTVGAITWSGATEREDEPGYYLTSAIADVAATTTGDVTVDATANTEQWFKLVVVALNGAPASRTGSASLTEADDTLSAAGVLPLASAATLVEADDTLGAAGTLPLTGQAAIVEGDDTVAGAGALALSGTAGLAEADDTASATGTLALRGAGSVTEADDTLAGVGRLGLAGVAAVTEADDTLSAAGLLLSPGTGVLAVVEADDGLAASGALLLTASADLTEAPDSVSGTGTLQLQGSMGLSEGDDSVVSAGMLRLAAVAGLIEADDVLSAAGLLGGVAPPVAGLRDLVLAARPRALALPARARTLTVVEED